LIEQPANLHIAVTIHACPLPEFLEDLTKVCLAAGLDLPDDLKRPDVLLRSRGNYLGKVWKAGPFSLRGGAQIGVILAAVRIPQCRCERDLLRAKFRA